MTAGRALKPGRSARVIADPDPVIQNHAEALLYRTWSMSMLGNLAVDQQ
jgi:hypothetical protein